MKTSKNKKEINVNVLKHLKEIPRIIWYPIAAIIHTIFSLMQHLYVISLRISKKQEFEEEHSTKIMRRAIKNILTSNSNVMNNYSNRSVNKIFTLMLELISFATTYVGFKFFLGNVSQITPIFMAIVVQGGCYYMLNYTSSHKHAGVGKRNSLLILLIVISTLTSYMGIFNGIISPTEYMENAYTQYQTTSNSLLDDYLKSKNYEVIDKSLINEYYDQCNSLVEQANIITESKDLGENFVTGSWQRNKYGSYFVVNSELAIEKQKKQEEIDTITGYVKNLNDFTEKYPEENVAKAYDAIIKEISILDDATNENTIAYRAFNNFIRNYRSLYKLIYNDKKSDEKIMKSLNAKKIVSNKEERDKLLLSDYSELISVDDSNSTITNSKNSKKTTLKTSLERFASYLLPMTEINCEPIRKTINDTVEDNYFSLKNKLDENDNEKLTSAYSAAIIPNTQFLPFILPFTAQENKSEIIGTTIFSALLAIAVDGLALMFSIALLNRRDSSLYYNNVDDFKRLREEIMEDCLMYNCLNSIDDLNEIDVNEVNSIIANELNDVMGGFMEKVKQCYFPTSFNSYGYICDDDLNSFNNAEKNIFISLNNISMIKPFHIDELIAVLNNDFSQVDSNNNISEKASQTLISKYEEIFEDDKVYYMVSKSVHVWFCDNFSELLENNKIFDNQNNDILKSNKQESKEG